jgi:hypothetical protein
MAVQNSNFNTLITAIDTKAQSLAASATDPKDLVFLGKTLEALNVTATVSDIIGQGDTQIGLVNTAGTTQVGLVNTAGTTQLGLVNTAGTNQVASINSAAASYSQHPSGTTTAVNKTLAANEFVLVTASAKTMTLPAGVAGQSVVYIAVGNFVDTVVAPNGSEKIMGLAQSMTIDKANTTITLMYHSAAHGWRAF